MHRLVGIVLTLGFMSLTLPLKAEPNFGDDASQWANDHECDDPRFQGEGSATTLLDEDRGHDATDCHALFEAGRIALRADDVAFGDDGVRRGRLEDGDATLASGEYADNYTFAGSSGQRAIIDLRSGDFDPYVFVRAPSGEQFDNDDYDGDSSRSRLALEITEDGDYEVTVTSYDEGETGTYTLDIVVAASAPALTRMNHSGALGSGDDTLPSGEFVDWYEFEGWPGQHVAIDLRSPAFDTYLILKDPTGQQTENDDADDGDVGHSLIETELSETGTYSVLVTSYESGETGAYRLTIDPSEPRQRHSSPNRDVTILTVRAPSTESRPLAYQQLVVDRGGSGPFDVLFER